MKFGVTKWIDCKDANRGDYYRFVAQKFILKIALSKEILTKRGLVSIYDYYQKAAHI